MDLVVSNEAIDKVNEFKYLGLVLDSSLPLVHTLINYIRNHVSN